MSGSTRPGRATRAHRSPPGSSASTASSIPSIADNTGGHLMQHGMVDLAITGTDRVTAQGDVCNKIGTYLKALAAKDNNVPFYVALPSPTIDFTVSDGLTEIPIEQRGGDEQATMTGRTADGRIETVQVIPGRLAGRELRLRRDAGAACHGPDHRARHRPGDARGIEGGVSGAGRARDDDISGEASAHRACGGAATRRDRGGCRVPSFTSRSSTAPSTTRTRRSSSGSGWSTSIPAPATPKASTRSALSPSRS